MLAKLSIDSQAILGFSLHNRVIRHGNRIWIGDNSQLHQKKLHATHYSALGGHSGFTVMYMCLKQLFDWRGMKTAAREFVRACLICQQARPDHARLPDRARLPGLLRPLPLPASAWQVISMDFVEGLPQSGNANCILVVVDSFTKYCHFYTHLQQPVLPKSSSTTSTACTGCHQLSSPTVNAYLQASFGGSCSSLLMSPSR